MNRCAGLLLVAIALGPSVARAQMAPDAFEAFYAKLTDSTIRARKVQQEKVEGAAKHLRAYEVSLHEPTLTTANATTASELAQAAISTSVDGADAGITVSPLALFGMQASAFQLSATLAALKGGTTRVVGAATYQMHKQRVDIDDCKPVDESHLRVEALAIHDGYKQACDAITMLGTLPLLGDAENQRRGEHMIAAARYACGLEPSMPRTVSSGQTILLHAIDEITTMYAPLVAASQDALQAKLAALQTAKNALGTKKAGFAECHTADEIGNTAVRTAWKAHIVRIGVSIREDRAQRVFGFNPDPSKPLSDGRLLDGEVRAELSYSHERIQVALGVGGGEGRIALTDPLLRYVSPAFSAAVIVGSLTSESLMDGNHVRVVNGALPPRFVVGVDALLQYVPSPPDTYEKLKKLAVTAYGDFRFTDKLAFRVGVPLTADLVTREADDTKMPPITAKHALQWTIPVFVATVIKL
jgi:hypothetical protein